MPIILFAWHILDAHYQAFFLRRSDTDLYAKFIELTHYALGNAFNFRRMQAVELIFIFTLLCEYSFHYYQYRPCRVCVTLICT